MWVVELEFFRLNRDWGVNRVSKQVDFERSIVDRFDQQVACVNERQFGVERNQVLHRVADDQIVVGAATEKVIASLPKDQVFARTTDGRPYVMRSDNVFYQAGWPDQDLAIRLLADLCQEAGIQTTPMPEGLRQRRAGKRRFLFNYSTEPVSFGVDLAEHGLSAAAGLRQHALRQSMRDRTDHN